MFATLSAFAQTLPSNFWDYKLGDLLTAALVATALLAYFLDRKSESRERRIGQEERQQQELDIAAKQAQMHTENTERLNRLLEFRTYQEALNVKRDEQINLLMTMASTAIEANKGFNHRLNLIENQYIRKGRAS